MEPENIIEMLHITKEFPGIIANDDITLQLRRGEIHALLGENGAGKSTLMSVLFGLYQPEAGEIRKIDLIVNRIRMDMVKRGDMMSIEDVVDILAVHLIGAVPDDEHIVISTNQGEPLTGSDSMAGQAYMNIARRVTGEDVPMLDLNVKNGFFSRLAGVFKKK